MGEESRDGDVVEAGSEFVGEISPHPGEFLTGRVVLRWNVSRAGDAFAVGDACAPWAALLGGAYTDGLRVVLDDDEVCWVAVACARALEARASSADGSLVVALEIVNTSIDI